MGLFLERIYFNMDSIQIKGVLPSFTSGAEVSASEVWMQDICFRKGENHLVLGNSGRGKSSLFSYVFGERSDYKGEILYDGQEIEMKDFTGWNAVRIRHISCIFQGLRLFPELTVWENITIKNRLTSWKKGNAVKDMLKKAGLADKKNEKAARLSFGQQQRVAIIRALCQPFDFLLADEPFSHLDETNIQLMAELIAQELEQQKSGIILSSLGADYPFSFLNRWKL